MLFGLYICGIWTIKLHGLKYFIMERINKSRRKLRGIVIWFNNLFANKKNPASLKTLGKSLSVLKKKEIILLNKLKKENSQMSLLCRAISGLDS